MIRLYALVAAGGAIGSMARFWLATLVARQTGPGFPWGTILINITGSFIIGALAPRATPTVTAFAMAGLCGGFTTFSAFSLQTFELLRAARYIDAMINIAVSVAACLAATALGFAISK
jgi:CrcB protein